VTASGYAWWTDHEGPGVEWAGTVALLLSGTLCATCGMYFAFVARRIEPRPEDRDDADTADGSGVVGFFSPGSYWPFGLALAGLVAATGVVFWQFWLVGLGLVGLLVTTGGLLFEYYTSGRRGGRPVRGG